MKSSATSCPVLTILLLADIFTLGCGGKQAPVAPVAGKVTYEGQPLAGGRILFLPVGGGKQGIGAIQPDGSFQLTTFHEDDGALVGNHNALILNATLSSGEKKTFNFQRSKSAPVIVRADEENELAIGLPADEWEQLDD